MLAVLVEELESSKKLMQGTAGLGIRKDTCSSQARCETQLTTIYKVFHIIQVENGMQVPSITQLNNYSFVTQPDPYSAKQPPAEFFFPQAKHLSVLQPTRPF